MECKQCGGTGLIINNKYCRCAAGKRKKAVMETIKAVAEKLGGEAKASAPPVDRSNRFLQVRPSKHKHDIKIGDWVERDGLVCMVNEIAGEDVRVFSYRSTKGAKVNFKGWVNIATLNPMPLEGFEDYKPMAVDLALLTEDAKWFKQLMKAGVKS